MIIYVLISIKPQFIVLIYLVNRPQRHKFQIQLLIEIIVNCPGFLKLVQDLCHWYIKVLKTSINHQIFLSDSNLKNLLDILFPSIEARFVFFGSFVLRMYLNLLQSILPAQMVVKSVVIVILIDCWDEKHR